MKEIFVMDSQRNGQTNEQTDRLTRVKQYTPSLSKRGYNYGIYTGYHCFDQVTD